jgi:hypothetical protein
MSINCVFVIIMLNVPLIAALQFGAKAPAFLKNNIGAGKVWGMVGSWTGKNTFGKTASMLAESEAMKNFASRSSMGVLALKGVRNAAQSYDKDHTAGVKERTEFAESLGYNKEQARIIETKIREMRREAAGHRASGDMDSAKLVEAEIRKKEDELREIKVKRKETYAKGRQSIWMKVASKANPAAASKILTETMKARIDAENKKLEKIRDDIKSKKQAIDRLDEKVAGQNGVEHPPQTKLRDKINADLKDNYKKEEASLKTLAALEDELENI